MARTRLTYFFEYVMHNKGHTIFNDVDDFIGIALVYMVQAPFDTLLIFLRDLGFPIRISKLVQPSLECNCLGVLVNTDQNITKEKLWEIMQKC